MVTDTLDEGIWDCVSMQLAQGVAALSGFLVSLDDMACVSGWGRGRFDCISRMMGSVIV